MEIILKQNNNKSKNHNKIECKQNNLNYHNLDYHSAQVHLVSKRKVCSVGVSHISVILAPSQKKIDSITPLIN